MSEFRQTQRTPVLEWSDIKAVAPRLSAESPAVVEQLGCWSTRSADQKDPTRAHNLMHQLGLDVSYTRVPTWTRYNPHEHGDPHISFFPLSELIYPVDSADKPEDNTIMASSPLGAELIPDTRMACLDNLYYAAAGSKSFEWERPWSPVWRAVGRHLKFSDHALSLTNGYLQRAFNLPSDYIPPVTEIFPDV